MQGMNDYESNHKDHWETEDTRQAQVDRRKGLQAMAVLKSPCGNLKRKNTIVKVKSSCLRFT